MTDSQFGRFLELRTETERRRVEFIKTEVDTGLTFAALAKTELAAGNREHAAHSAVNAKKAYDTAVAQIAQAESISAAEHREIDEKMTELAAALEHLPR